MKTKWFVAIALVLSLSLYLLHLPLVNAVGGLKTWGTGLTVKQYITVGNNEEIPVGNWGYVFQQQNPGEKVILGSDWKNMISGNLETLRQDIESKIPGSQVTWIQISWEKETYDPMQYFVAITGFRVEAIVQNIAAGMTGLEIAVIIMAIAFLIAIIGLLLTGSWVTWNIIDATQKIGPSMTILVGIGILAGIGFLLYSLFGGKVKYSKTSRTKKLELGKA